MTRHQTAWWLWAVGTALIVLSWVNVVTATIGWCGFGIGLAGSVLGWGMMPPQSATTAPTEEDEANSVKGTTRTNGNGWRESQ